MVEMLPMLVIFIILFGLLLGFWSTVHRGTLQNMSARHYAFEVLNNRTHFIYHRDTPGASADKSQDYYEKPGFRYFAIVESQTGGSPVLRPPRKEINLFDLNASSKADKKFSRWMRDTTQANPVQLKQGYGICLDCKCGGIRIKGSKC